MAKQTNIIVTGSTKGSRIAWTMSRELLRLYGAKAHFFHPKQWNKDIQMDGLLITGGIDVDPHSFNLQKHKSIVKTEPQRDIMELFLLQRAVLESVPVLGICRGMQLINLFMGGSLHSHIPDLELDFEHPHSTLPKNTLSIEHKSRLYRILRTDSLSVNALHHQTVDKLGKQLIVAARDRNALIQAIESTEKKFIMGLQWHPEFMPYHWSSHRIFKAFCKEAKKHSALK